MLVDAFMFYNELDVLELRLTVLDRYVDKFVLVESELTHVGTTKELVFEKNKERFGRWLPKIEHVIMTATESPKDENPWAREKYQRNCILRGLENIGANNETIVMVSDLDEIPNLVVVPFENMPHLFLSVHMWMFEYSFDFMFTGEPWFGTVITNYELFKRVGPNYLRDNRWKFPVCHYAGWHLSSFGDAKHVVNKLKTFAHANDKHDLEWNEATFERIIASGIHTDGKTELIHRSPEVPLPAPVEVLRRLNLGAFP